MVDHHPASSLSAEKKRVRTAFLSLDSLRFRASAHHDEDRPAAVRLENAVSIGSYRARMSRLFSTRMPLSMRELHDELRQLHLAADVTDDGGAGDAGSERDAVTMREVAEAMTMRVSPMQLRKDPPSIDDLAGLSRLAYAPTTPALLSG